MNTLSTIYSKFFSLAAATATPKANDKAPSTPFISLKSDDNAIIGPWQVLFIVILVALLVFWWIYRKKQQENQ